ncbi:hypothetical protein MZM55_12420, partial [Escherichia coli]|nr:hypothetical protein [Escherichia coli]
ADTCAWAISDDLKNMAEIILTRVVYENLSNLLCEPLTYLTPLIAKLGYCPDAGLQFWAGWLSLPPIMRNVTADTD